MIGSVRRSVLRPILIEWAGAAGASSAVVVGEPGSLLEQELDRVVPGPVAAIPAGGLREMPDGGVEIVAAESLLMWSADQEAVVREIERILLPGGRALLMAEPDFHGVMEHPGSAGFHGLLAGVLRKRGADPEVGRKLRSLFGPDSWSTRIAIHPPDPGPGPAGQELEDLVSHVRSELRGAVAGPVVDRWEAEVRSASADGSLFLYAPFFALVARKVS